ncbi:MAG: hypothetical protein JRN17_02415 [Nitrososphaerota archaeon]|nr:hypothetical protein [Nitrososphaerota archaeon]
MWEEEELGKYKIDPQGNLVDMTKLARKELAELEKYYVAKWERARSPDMKLAYRQSVDQIRKYAYEGQIEGGADVFCIAHRMDVVDVRSMIRTYFGSLAEFRSKTREREFSRIFEARTEKYTQPGIPSDETIRRVFGAVTADPPRLQEAADLFTGFYGVSKASVDVGSRKDYHMTTDYKGTIYVSLDRFENDTQLLEALFELLFDHLSYSRSWRFADDPELSFTREKEERLRFSIAAMDRCVDLGLLSKGGP